MGEPETLLASLRDRLAASRFHTWAGMEVVVAAAPGEVTVAMRVEGTPRSPPGPRPWGVLTILADTARLSIRSALKPAGSP